MFTHTITIFMYDVYNSYIYIKHIYIHIKYSKQKYSHIYVYNLEKLVQDENPSSYVPKLWVCFLK